jgi:hypothetical protein
MKKFTFLAAMIASLFANAFALNTWYWTSDVDISNMGLHDGTANSFQRSIAIPLNTSSISHVAFIHQSGSTGNHVYYTKRNGTVWSTPIDLDNMTHESFMGGVSIATDPTGTCVYVVYMDDMDDTSHPYEQILMRKSMDGGNTWSDPIRVSPNLLRCYYQPVVAAASNGKVFVAWNENTYAGSEYIGFRQSSDSGETWLDPVLNLQTEGWPGDAYMAPSIDTDPTGNYVHVAWRRISYGGIEYDIVAYRRLNVTTNTWGPCLNLITRQYNLNQPYSQQMVPSITCAKDGTNKVHVVWHDDSAHPNVRTKDVFYMRSADNGDTWGSPVMLSSNANDSTNSLWPVITCGCANSNYIDILYSELYGQSNTTSKIYWRRSTNGGSSWSARTLLPTGGDPNGGGSGVIDLYNQSQIVFGSSRSGYGEVYYKGYYSTVIAEERVPGRNGGQEALPTTNVASGLRITPNPVRENAQISFAAVGNGSSDVTASIYDIQGRFVRNLKLSNASGRLVTTWDGRNATGLRAGSGVYLISVKLNGKTETGRIIIAK